MRGHARRLTGLRPALLALVVVLSACAPRPKTGDPAARAAASASVALPAMRQFPAPRPVAPQRANRDILRDFLDLSFAMESGRALPYFSRFEEPVTVRLAGAPSAVLAADLDRLIRRLRAEAGLDIRRVTGREAHITVEVVSRAQIRRHVPNAACFVVPNISRLAEYRQARTLSLTDWTRIARRERVAIFVPGDSSPQEARDCLHEELAQALGPLNDLYRVADSVFNDDNVHAVLTGFDMLILRAYYAPELASGMTRAEVAARLPAILGRLNPQGARIPPRDQVPTPRAWTEAIQTAFGPGTRPAARRSAATRALRIARGAGLDDHRLGFSHFAVGKLMQAREPERAQAHFIAADRAYRRSPGTELHRAHVAVHLASDTLSEGRARDALARIEPHLETAERHENAALLATLLMLQADALEMTGQGDAARRVRLDSLAWARYGFGLSVAVPVAAMRARPGQPGSKPEG
ncbi:DUF2927 domain-containing protein [Roseovarius sp. D22-M7]